MENLLQCIDQVQEERIREVFLVDLLIWVWIYHNNIYVLYCDLFSQPLFFQALKANAEKACLSKNLVRHSSLHINPNYSTYVFYHLEIVNFTMYEKPSAEGYRSMHTYFICRQFCVRIFLLIWFQITQVIFYFENQRLKILHIVFITPTIVPTFYTLPFNFTTHSLIRTMVKSV